VQTARLVRTTGFRLVAWYAAVFGASAAILLGIVYWIGVSAVEQQLYDSVTREMRLLVDVYDTRGREALERAVNRRASELTSPRRYYRLQAADGTRIAGNLPRMEPMQAVGTISTPARELADPPKVDEGATQSHSMLAEGRLLSGGEFILVGESRYRVLRATEAIVRAVMWGAPLTVLLALGGGVLLANNYLRRIDEVNRTLSSIMEGDLAQRVRTRGSGDEMDRLAENLNAMLERIQSLMEGIKRVSDDVAHDLRTPLSRLRQRLENARAHGAAAAHDRVIDQSIADLDAILDTFGALLRIAQVESGARRAAFAKVDLGALAGTVAEVYAPVAEDRGQRLTLKVDADACVHGDRELLLQMLTNLVENAIQHSPAGAQIVLGLAREGDAALVQVSDTGPGVPAAERSHVFRRFYRLQTSRTTPGSGLGLALVKAVVDLHGGSVELDDNAPGLRVRVRFARLAAAQEPASAARETAAGIQPRAGDALEERRA
jgi:signal transduction histidine kinase